MSGNSLYTLDASAITLGAVLARGSPGVTLYQANLLVGSQPLKVAVKRLQTCGAPAAIESAFVKEMQTLQLASGSCQRACRLLGCCNINGDACIVMSLYPKAAAKRLEEAQGPLPLEEVIAIGLEVLEGLEQLHETRILHLDLKPANILLDKHGHAYLSDFGISHAIRTLETCTAVTGMSGTPHYMAPEQVDAEFGIRGTHTDVWGFAASILHLATGQLPYAELSQMQMVSAMSKRRPPNVPASLPNWLQQALQQSFSFDVGVRPTVDKLQQLFKTQARQGHTDSGAQPPLPAASGTTAQSHQAAAAKQQVTHPSSVKGLLMSSVMSGTVATVRAARARLGRIPNQEAINDNLMDAVRGNSFIGVQQALLKGAALDAVRSGLAQWAALHTAAARDDLRILEILLALGADVDIRDSNDNRTPLMCAESAGAVKLLLSYGADIDPQDCLGMTPLMWAVNRSLSMELVEELLPSGADIHARDIGGHTVLMRACWRPQTSIEMLEKLLSYKANVHARDNEGQTALMHAAKKGRSKNVLDTLLVHGADIHAIDDEGRSALDWARLQNKAEAQHCLEMKLQRQRRKQEVTVPDDD